MMVNWNLEYQVQTKQRKYNTVLQSCHFIEERWSSDTTFSDKIAV